MAIGDLTARLKAKFKGRPSTASSVSSSTESEAYERQNLKTPRSLRSRASHQAPITNWSASVDEKKDKKALQEKQQAVAAGGIVQTVAAGHHKAAQDSGVLEQARYDLQTATVPTSLSLSPSPSPSPSTSTVSVPETKLLDLKGDSPRRHDTNSTGGLPTPSTDIQPVPEEEPEDVGNAIEGADPVNSDSSLEVNSPAAASAKPSPQRPSEIIRRQSLLPDQQTSLIKTLLESDLPPETSKPNPEYTAKNGPSDLSPRMVSRKIWVKRPGASATLVTINEEDLVDDVRDMILKKYANSLGRNFDAPDVTLKIVPREPRQERTLGPEEPMGRTLDAYFPGGQIVEEALVIDVPSRRTPKPSPQPTGRYYEDHRPAEAATDYFPPMPVPAMPSPHLPNSAVNGHGNPHQVPLTSHSMSVLTTGHVPALPSPGSTRRHHAARPRIGRQHTTSPVVMSHTQPHTTPGPVNNGTQLTHLRGPRSRTHSSASEKSNPVPAAPPLPTPPIIQNNDIQPIPTPPARVSSPRPTRPSRRSKKSNQDHPSLVAGMLNGGGVPPINVLIIEDNIINLKLLEAFMKRLKVRWQTAMNGRDAVTKWRGGGFHLVLMDIQLPIMNGLEATKAIRRLERLNSIGVFNSSASSNALGQHEEHEPQGDDKLPSTLLFKSPVIIVALTASSLQSDRHEALTAGCNDFLTKPVNFVWLERKVMEWGCMQALIDFDGWRKWKDFSNQNGNGAENGDAPKEKSSTPLAARKIKNRTGLSSNSGANASKLAIMDKTEQGESPST